MAIEFFDGFEGGTQPGWLFSTMSVSTTAVRTGVNGLVCTATSTATLNLSASAKKTVGFAYTLVSTIGYGLSTIAPAQFCSDAGATIHLTLMTDATGHLVLRRGATNGTVLATSTQIYPTNQWRYIEMQATIADSGGTCIVRVDGVEWINVTGDTRNAGTSTNIDAVKLNGSSTTDSYWDDMYVTNGTDDTAVTGRADDGFLGDIKVEPLLPSGNGASSQWVGSDSNSTDNYLLVDEQPVNTTDYVGSATDGNRDLWDLPSVAASALQVLAIRPSVYAAKTDAGAASIKQLVRTSDGTVTTDTTQPLSTTYATYWGALRTTKPGGGAWTPTDVNGLQIGVEKA